MPTKDDKLGALWNKTSEKGPYMSGEVQIEGQSHRLVIFLNKFKEGDPRKPDWVIYRSTPREQ